MRRERRIMRMCNKSALFITFDKEMSDNEKEHKECPAAAHQPDKFR